MAGLVELGEDFFHAPIEGGKRGQRT